MFYPRLGAEQAGPKTYGSYGSGSSFGNPPPLFPASPNDLKVVGNEKQGGPGSSYTFTSVLKESKSLNSHKTVEIN
jgi:hypothetical protein